MDLIEENVWADGRILSFPRTYLVQWQVIEISGDDYRSYHFIGRCRHLRQSTVSDQIVSFHPILPLGLGQFGMVYELTGPHGFNRKANIMLQTMLRGGGSFQDLTQKYEMARAEAAAASEGLRKGKDLKEMHTRTMCTHPITGAYARYLEGIEEHDMTKEQLQNAIDIVAKGD